MNNKILILAVAFCFGFASCSTYSGPQYNVQTDDQAKNGGQPGSSNNTPDYKEDMSYLIFKLDGILYKGTNPHKAIRVVNGTIVSFTLSYDFVYEGKNMIMSIYLPDYRGLDVYGRAQEYPASILIHENLDPPPPAYDMTWNGAEEFNVTVTYQDEKYIEASFTGLTKVVNGGGEEIGVDFFSDGVIKTQIQR